MIEDLDVIVETRPSLRERWLLPAVATVAVAAVLVSSYAQLAPLRQAVFREPPARVGVPRPAGPAGGFKALQLPRTIATVETRTQFSGVTGLTPTALSDGFRDLYRLTDGRVLLVIEYPDRTNGLVITSGAQSSRPVTVRGVKGQSYTSDSTSMPLAVAWVADGMQYQVGGAGFATDELVKLAEALR